MFGLHYVCVSFILSRVAPMPQRALWLPEAPAPPRTESMVRKATKARAKASRKARAAPADTDPKELKGVKPMKAMAIKSKQARLLDTSRRLADFKASDSESSGGV